MALTERAYLILYEMAEYNEEICEESVHFKQNKTKQNKTLGNENYFWTVPALKFARGVVVLIYFFFPL